MSRESADQIQAEASRWLMRLDREGRTDALVAELDVWLAADRRRRGAWLQAEAAWRLLDTLGSGEPAEDWAEGEPVSERDCGEDERPTTGTFGRRKLLLGGAAALAASIAGALLFVGGAEHYETRVGEIRRLPLADGSTATINTDSVLDVAFAPRQRSLELEQGEAFFQVAHDLSRPFLVQAGRVKVMAVGTAFSVRRREGGAEVLVSEGVVEAWADGAPRIRLTAGSRAFVAEAAAASHVVTDLPAVDRALAWRSGSIDLAGETLAEAVAEFNRYNRRQILIADPRLSGERFYGLFRTDDPAAFALSVNGSLRVPIEADARQIRIGRPAS